MNQPNRIQFAVIPLAFMLGLLAGYLTWGRAGSTPASASTEAVAETAARAPDQAAGDPQQEVVRYDVPEDDDPVLGSDQAPITIIEFSDYECPYCRRWHLEAFPLIREAFPDQVRFVFRDFPLTSIHPNAVPAAEAANCAFEQGLFWEFNEKLFSGAALSPAVYNQYAEDLGMDLPRFKECVASGRYRDEVLADLAWATNLGVSSTPTFFINGIALVGAQPFEVFKQIIEKELAGEIP